MKKLIEHPLSSILWILGLCLVACAFFLTGCVSCPECRADDHVMPSPQVPSKGWQPARVPLPGMVSPPPVAQAPRPRQDFATPPTDGPDPATPPEPPAPALPPAPPEPPAPAPVRKAKLVTTAETDGGIIISGNSAPVYYSSPGATPQAALAPAQALAPAPAPALSYPLIPGPLPDAQAYGIARRVGGSLYYLATGKCPTTAAPAAATMQFHALVPAQAIAAVPVQMQMQAMAAPAAMMMVPYAAPVPSYSPVPAAAPQAVYAPSPAPRKCRFFP